MGAYADLVLADSPALYWKMDEASGEPQDSSGNARHGSGGLTSITYRGAGVGAPLADGDELYAMVSDSTTGDSIRRDDVTGLNDTTTLTVECWWKRGADDGADGILFEIGRAVMVGNGYYLYWQDSDGKLVCKAGNDGGILCASNDAVAADTWYHIAIVESAGTWTMFINGIAQTTANADTVTAPATSIALFRANSSDLLHGEGSMAHFAIYQVALSGSSIAAHFAAEASAAGGRMASNLLPSVIC